MRSLKVLVPLAVALALALGAFAVPAAAATPATVPTWTQGQSVGYGVHYDLGLEADTYLLNAIRTNPSAFGIKTINALNVTGSLDSWQLDTVSQVTSSQYTLSSQAAQGIKLHVVANLTVANATLAGTYNGTLIGGSCFPPSIQYGPLTEAVTLDATILSTSTGTTHLLVSNLSYLSEASNTTLQASVAFTGYHLPTVAVNLTKCQEIVTYENPTFTLSANTQTALRIFFGVPWDFFNFPIADGNTWWANSTATVGATLSGTVNVQGLSSQDQKAFFDNLTKSFESSGLIVTGLDAFPIDLSKISVLVGPKYIVNNGVVTDANYPIQSRFRAIASPESLSDGTIHPTYLITDASYECPTVNYTALPYGFAAVYAPDFPAAGAGMIVGYQVIACGPTGTTSVAELQNTSPSETQNKIGQTESTYQVTPTTENPIANFFLQAPYLGLILIAVVVVLVAALLVVRHRRKASLPPPPSPPPPASP